MHGEALLGVFGRVEVVRYEVREVVDVAQIAAAVAANVEHERVYACCRRLSGRERDVCVSDREKRVCDRSILNISLFDVYAAHTIVRQISLFRHTFEREPLLSL